jgi:HSP20 family protein
MLMRTDPFRDLDRFTQQLLGTNARPSAMLMDAWRDGDRFVVEFDLPGVSPDSVDLDVERNVLTVTAQRPPLNEKAEFLAAERPRGVFSRQLVLGENLDLDRIEAAYRDGVLRLHIPVAERAKPRKITINRDADPGDQAITTGRNGNGNGNTRQRSDSSVDAVTA